MKTKTDSKKKEVPKKADKSKKATKAPVVKKGN